MCLYFCTALNVLLYTSQCTSTRHSMYSCTPLNVLLYTAQRTLVQHSMYSCAALNVLLYSTQCTPYSTQCTPVYSSTYSCTALHELPYATHSSHELISMLCQRLDWFVSRWVSLLSGSNFRKLQNVNSSLFVVGLN